MNILGQLAQLNKTVVLVDEQGREIEEKEKELKRKQLELERRAEEIQRKEEVHVYVANKENHQKQSERRKQDDSFNNLKSMVVPSSMSDSKDDAEEDFGKYRLSVL